MSRLKGFPGRGEPREHEDASDVVARRRKKVLPYPSGEYSRLNTAPWVLVFRLTDSTAGFIEQYKLVIVLKLSLAGSTNTPRLIVLLCSQENRSFPRSPLPVCGAAVAV